MIKDIALCDYKICYIQVSIRADHMSPVNLNDYLSDGQEKSGEQSPGKPWSSMGCCSLNCYYYYINMLTKKIILILK
jgi:hypothetical protein